MNSLKLKMNTMNKLKYLLTLSLVLGGCTTSKVTETSGVYYQAFDENWSDDPSINPIFETNAEAEEYAKRNNMGEFIGGHSYEVRVINYRYEVRIVNPSTNEVLHTTNEYNDAYEYVVEYSSAHADLIIYDLKTGESYEETP